MYPVGDLNVLGLVMLIWLIALTFFYWKERVYLQKLFPQGEDKDIRNKLKEVTEIISGFTKEKQVLTRSLQEFRRESLGFVSKVEIMRYNPYGDTGGDQSSTIVFLDGKLNGFLLTSLHSRAGTRVYTKVIAKGESDLELSKEEEIVLKKAIQKYD